MQPLPACPSLTRDPLPPACAPRPHRPPPQLYQQQGYVEVGRDPPFRPNRRCLMKKDVPPCLPANNISSVGGRWSVEGVQAAPASGSGSSSSGDGGGGKAAAAAGSRRSDGKGVYDWSDL